MSPTQKLIDAAAEVLRSRGWQLGEGHTETVAAQALDRLEMTLCEIQSQEEEKSA